VQEFLAEKGIPDGAVQSATRQPVRGDEVFGEAFGLFDGVTELWAAKYRKVHRVAFSAPGELPPDRAALRKLMLGRTGKLRAPTLRVGRRLVVGYHRGMLEAAFAD